MQTFKKPTEDNDEFSYLDSDVVSKHQKSFSHSKFWTVFGDQHKFSKVPGGAFQK